MPDEVQFVVPGPPDSLSNYISLRDELKEERNREQDTCKDLRSILSQGLALAKAHILQTWQETDGIEDPFEDPRWGLLSPISDTLRKAKMTEGYASGLQGSGYDEISTLREDNYMDINAGLYDAFSDLDALLMAWGVVPMMDKRTAMQILVSKKLMESLDDGRKFEIRTDAKS